MFQVIYSDDASVTLSKKNDTAYVQGNNTTVQGGSGDDRLATVLRGNEVERASLSTVLMGGNGSDTLHAALTLDGDPYSNAEDFWDQGLSMRAELHGGGGSDEIEALIASLYVQQIVVIDGGTGADRINVESVYSSSDVYVHGLNYHTASVEIDGGAGSDEINAAVSAGGTLIRGGDGDDGINAGSEYNVIHGDAGDDRITASAGQYYEWGGGGSNRVFGGDGDDFLDVGAGGSDSADNVAYGDAGDDTIKLSASAGGGPASSPSASNEGHGGDGADTITAEISLTTDLEWDVIPESAINRLYGDGGDDSLSARIDVDDPSGGQFYSELHGGAGDDRLSVSGGDGNVLFGNQGDDTLLGSANGDRLIGGQGADYLRGNGGADTFEFWGARGLSARERDRVADFTIGEDLIDVSRIDAKSWRPGNQAFTFDVDGEGRSGTLWVADNPDNWGSIVYANTGKAMLAINLLDGRSVDAGDYSASDFIL